MAKRFLQRLNCMYKETRCSRKRQTSPPMLPPGELDQTTLSDVRLVPLPGELDETYAPSLILAHSNHYVQIWRHPQNRKYIKYRTAVREGPSHGYS